MNTTREGNFVIFQGEGVDLEDEISYALNLSFGTMLPVAKAELIAPMYRTEKDAYGLYRKHLSGEFNVQTELRYHIERAYHYQVLGYGRNEELITHLKRATDREVVLKFVEKNREEMTVAIKTLLRTLKALKEMKQSKESVRLFVQSLDELIAQGQLDTIVSMPIALFEGGVENITSYSMEENMKEIEHLLFQLKREIKLFASILEELVTDENFLEESSGVTQEV